MYSWAAICIAVILVYGPDDEGEKIDSGGLNLVIVLFYGFFALVGLLNLVLMRRPGLLSSGKPPLVLIPARNEAANLQRLVPALLKGQPNLEIVVFDDESEDDTGLVARQCGAKVISPSTPLPEGWTGKNWACHELAKHAATTDAEWWLFIDADVHPSPDFIPAMSGLCGRASSKVGVITGFPQILPGEGIEPLFLAWVGWILLTTNPYGLVNRMGLGHSRFKNGQMHCWRREVYERLQPNLQVRSQIMEDVMIGRMLARRGVSVEVANLSSVVAVRMYDHWRQTFDGMSKNSYEITGSVAGSIAVALFFLIAGWSWLLAGHLMGIAYGLLLLSGIFVCLIARTSWWPLLLAPIIPTIGAVTVLRSAVWHRRGIVQWKGRTYGHTKKGAAPKRVAP